MELVETWTAMNELCGAISLIFSVVFFFLLLFKTSPHLLRLFSWTLRCCFAPELFCGLWNFTRLSIGKSFVTICRQASAWQTALVPLCSTLEYYTHMWLLNPQFQKHGDKAFILKVLDRIKALCRSVKVFPNQQGEPCLYGAAFVCRDIIVLKRKKGSPPKLLPQMWNLSFLHQALWFSGSLCRYQPLLSFAIIFPTLKSNPSFVHKTGRTPSC